MGDSFTVADLELPQGVTVLSDPSEMLAVMTVPAVAEVEEEVEDLELDEDAEPEVVGAEDEEEEAEE